MSASEVLARYGTWALVRFVLTLLAFVLVHLTRLPLLVLARLLEALMQRLDNLVATGLPTPPPAASPSPSPSPRTGEG